MKNLNVTISEYPFPTFEEFLKTQRITIAHYTLSVALCGEDKHELKGKCAIRLDNVLVGKAWYYPLTRECYEEQKRQMQALIIKLIKKLANDKVKNKEEEE